MLNKCDQEIEQSHNNHSDNLENRSSNKKSYFLKNDSFYSASTCGDVNKLRQIIFRRLGVCLENSELALISISALENLNVHKSANWILDALLSQQISSKNS